jgi:hypothetical protein
MDKLTSTQSPLPAKARLTRQEAADFLTANGFPFAASTLNKLFSIGGGPACVHFGRRPLYEPEELLRWARSRTSAPRKNSSEPRKPLIETESRG